MIHIIILVLAIPPSLLLAQQDGIYFSDDSGNIQMQIPPENLTQLRGTELYNDQVDKIISNGILKLTLAVKRALAQTHGRHQHVDNIVYAPVSIAGALALVLLGSNGKTFQETANLMGLATGVVDIQQKSQLVHEQFGRMIQKLQTTAGFDIGKQVNVAMAIFVQNGFPIREIYKQTAASVYQSEVINVDFRGSPQTAQLNVNAWVDHRTNGKIRELLTGVPPTHTKVILASAMYFKAEWEKPFFEGTTKMRPFFINGRKSKSEFKVEMMSNGGIFPYFRDTTLDCEVLGFPYKGNQTTMYVVMPGDSNQEKLQQLESKLTVEHIHRFLDNVKYTGALVLFPKMRIESTLDLKAPLESMGLKALFSPGQANLALLSPGEKYANVSAKLPDRKAVPAAASAPIEEKPQTTVTPAPPSSTPASLGLEDNDVFIFSRLGVDNSTCNQTEPSKNGTKCSRSVHNRSAAPKTVETLTGTIDNIRQYLNLQADAEKFENPGLYADSVIHKVYMDITESGTEAAAATAISLSRDGGRVTFRVDVPFFFFIMHEQTKTLLFWGSVNSPTPNFS